MYEVRFDQLGKGARYHILNDDGSVDTDNTFTKISDTLAKSEEDHNIYDYRGDDASSRTRGANPIYVMLLG